MSNVSERAPKEAVKRTVQRLWSLPEWPRRLGHYGLALLFVGMAAVLRWALPEVLGPTPFLAFYLAWVGAAAFGGFGPGLLAVVVSWLCIDLMFDPANNLIRLGEPATMGRLVVLLAGGLAVSLVAERMRRGRIHERKQSRELALAKQEWERTFDAVPDLIAVLDPQYRILRANRAMAERLGTTVEGCIGLTCYHCAHDLDAPPDFCPLVRSLADGQEHTAEFYEERLGGHFFVTCTPLLDPDGHMIGSVHVAHDITERKQAEQILRDSEERFRAAYEQAAIGIEMLDLEGHLLRGNGWLGQMLGYSEDELRQHTFAQITHPDDLGEELPLLGKLLAGEIPSYSIEKRYLHKDGHPVWVRVTSSMAHTSSPYRLSIIEDVTERKRAEQALLEAHTRLQMQAEELQASNEELAAQEEELRTANEELREQQQALRKSEAQLRTVVENLVEGLVIADLDGRLFHWNHAALEMHGFASLEECQRRLPELADTFKLSTMDGQVLPVEQWPLARILRGENLRDWEVRVQRIDRNWQRVFSYGGSLVRDQQGQQLLAVVTVNDVTERKRAEEAMHEANERLQEQAEELQAQAEELREQAEELTTANEELRESEQALRESEEQLRQLNLTLESKVARRTAELEHRAKQLQKLTLELSAAEDRERKRLAEILHDDLQQVLAAAKFHLSLMKSRARHDPSLQATATQIDQMLKDAIDKSRSLSHELSPAVLHHGDFTEVLGWLASQVQAKHGLIVHVYARGNVHSQSDTLRTFLYRAAQELLFNVVKHARVNEATIRIRRVGRWICLSVSDRGRGFDPQHLKEAAGFGLLNIRERVELLGGQMKIKSTKDKGSRFVIMVPDGELAVEDSSWQEHPAPAPQDHPDVASPDHDASVASEQQGQDALATAAGPQVQPRLRVLLADDHEIVREGLISLLAEEATIEIVGQAANGREAINLASELQPDVVIMDVSMPLINGDEATRQIKTLLPGARVVALSMFEDAETVERMHEAGAEAYVLKTAPTDELLAAIRGKTAGA